MKSVIPLFTLALLVCVGLAAQEKQPPPRKADAAAQAEFKIPPEAAQKQNPYKPTESSIAEGKHLYASQCAMCHGENGDGKGDVAVSMQLTLQDWREPASLKKWTDGELFYVLDKGKNHMPGQQGRMRDNQKWHLVNFIRSLAPKQKDTEEKKDP
jgi:mono/diheme cytochrome c family protein